MAIAEEKRKLSLKKHAINAIKLVCPYLRNIKGLIETTDEKRKVSLKSRCFNIIKYYVEYRRQLQQSDAFSIKKTFVIRLRGVTNSLFI